MSLSIELEKPGDRTVPVTVADVVDLFQHYFKIPASHIVHGKGTMYNAWLDGRVGSGCFASIKIPEVDSTDGIHLNIRLATSGGDSKFVYAKPQTDKTSRFKTGVIKREVGWKNQVVDHTNIGLKKCHAMSGSAGTKAKAKTTAPIAKAKAINLRLEKVTAGGFIGGKCDARAVGAGAPCKNIKAKMVGDSSGMDYYINIFPTNVKNYNAVVAGKTYAVPNLTCKTANSKFSGKDYQNCRVETGVSTTFMPK